MKNLNLRAFIELLKAGGELHTVRAEVDPDLEIAAITDKVCKSRQNRALLFNSVKGSSFRVATNLFGSERRISLALGIPGLSALTEWFDATLATLPGTSAAEKLGSLPATPAWSAAAPVSAALPAELHETAIDLTLLPVISNHPRDGQPIHGGKFLTLPLVITADPAGRELNCGMYRAAPLAPDRLAITWSSTSGAAQHAASWAAHGEPMPVVIALGCSPALTFAATLPLPAALDEFTFTGLLQNEAVQVFSCANGLPAPCAAEVVMEGYLQSAATGSGAFGNHTGFYTPSEPAAAVNITSLRIRSDLILPATVVGKPPMEDCWLARAGGLLLLSLLKIDVPEVVSLHQPFAGIFHGAAFIALRNAVGRGGELLAALRKSPWFAKAKLLVIVDAEQDPADAAGVLWRIMNSVNWREDVLISGDTLSVDATGKPSETRERVTSDPEISALVARRWKEYGFEP